MQAHKKSLQSVLIKPAGPDCNLDCTYCFYLDRTNQFPGAKIHRMSETVLEETVKQVLRESGRSVSFGWQGGEPTLAGLPFFEKAVEFQVKYGSGKSVGNGLQTNGILLDQSWAQFLKRYSFLVGLSIDGPEHVHDHYRTFKGGQKSWSKVIDSAKLLLDAGVEVNALSVVNDYSVQFPEEIYAFHKELGLDFMQFIPCVETDPSDPTKAAPFSVSAEAYGRFLVRIFDLWRADFHGSVPTTSVRFFDSVLHKYVGLNAPDCTLMQTCGVYVVVEHNGDVFACDFFVEPEWKLGNIMSSNVADMLNSPLQTKFGEWKQDLPDKCLQCQWLRPCRGGCTKDRVRDLRDNNLNHFCESYMMFFAHADKELRMLANDWMSRNAEPVMPTVSEPVQIQPAREQIDRNALCPCGSGKKYKKCHGA
ncbi:MAG TPA: anaerobic sulfatase maturase [Bacteroidota bacterium]|nr:anaerobic sulfatase maturase [Bacteroidota bacterium]